MHKIGSMGHTFGVRVQKVQRVLRVLRGRFLRWTGLAAGGFLSLTAFQAEGCGGGFAADFEEKGRGFAAGCVEGLWKKVLKIDRPLAGGFLSLTGPLAPRVVDCRSAVHSEHILKER